MTQQTDIDSLIAEAIRRIVNGEKIRLIKGDKILTYEKNKNPLGRNRFPFLRYTTSWVLGKGLETGRLHDALKEDFLAGYSLAGK